MLDAPAGGNIRASVQNDLGVELYGRTFSHGASAFPSGFELVLSQAMGEPTSPERQEVAVDYALLQIPEPGSGALIACAAGLWAVARRRSRRV